MEQWSALSGSPRKPAWRRRHDPQAGLEGGGSQVKRTGRGEWRAVQGQVCGRRGREKGKLGPQKWTGAATHSLASVAMWVGFHLRSWGAIQRCVVRDFLGEGPLRSRRRKRGPLGAIHHRVTPLPP